MDWGLDMDGFGALGLVVCGLVVCARLPWPHAYASVHGSSRSALANEVACSPGWRRLGFSGAYAVHTYALHPHPVQSPVLLTLCPGAY